MTIETSHMAILSDDPGLIEEVRVLLAPFGWTCGEGRDTASIVAVVTAGEAAVVLVDMRADGAEEVIPAIRRLPPPGNGMPILTTGVAVDWPGGPGGHVDRSLGNGFLEEMRRWAGPLDDHGMRASPWGPRYRMTRLLGLPSADAMLERLRDALVEAVEAERPAAHRLAGVAGLCGFADLSQAWARVDQGETGSLPPAIAASRAAIDGIDADLG